MAGGGWTPKCWKGAHNTDVWGPAPPRIESQFMLSCHCKMPKTPRKGKNVAAFGHFNAENFSASGGFTSSWGLCPHTPVISSHSALAMCPPHTGPSRTIAPENNFSLRPWLVHVCFVFFIVSLESTSIFVSSCPTGALPLIPTGRIPSPDLLLVSLGKFLATSLTQGLTLLMIFAHSTFCDAVFLL